MNIVILSPSDKSFISKFLPNYSDDSLPEGYFGAPFIGTIISELLSLGHKVTAITTTKAENGDYTIKRFDDGNFAWIVVPSRPHSIRLNGKKLGRIVDFFSLEQKNMIACIKEISPDIVHAHWSYEFAGAAVKSGYPHLITVHDNAFEVLRYFKNAYRFGRLIMSEQILKKVKFASTVSPYMLPYIKRKCQSAVVIPNPTMITVSADDVEIAISDKLKSLSSPRIIMINNGWDKRKNGIVGLKAFQQLQKLMPSAKLDLFGSGSEINGPANRDSDKFELSNVAFHGKVSHQKLITNIMSAHLLLHPAREESFGVVLIEAMSFGVPAIGGSNSGAVPWVLSDTRVLVDITEANKISDKLFELLSKEELYREIALKGYQNVISRFSSGRIVQQYLESYQKIISNRN